MSESMDGGDSRPTGGMSWRLDGLARLAVTVLDRSGAVTHLNRAARDFFVTAGVERDRVRNRGLTDLIDLPRDRRDVFQPRSGRILHAWSALLPVSGPNGVPREIAWWVFPLTGPGEHGLLTLSAEASALHRGPGLSVDGVTVAPPGASGSTARVLRVEPFIGSVAEHDHGRLAARLATALPKMGPAEARAIVEQVLAAGYPSITVTGALRLPVTPYWGGEPRLRGVRRPPATAAAPITPTALMEAAAARERLAFLTEAGAAIGSSLDMVQTAEEFCRALVPAFADFAAVQLLDEIFTDRVFPSRRADETTAIRRVAVVHNDEPGRWEDVVPVGEQYRLPADTPFVRAMVTGEPEVVRRSTPEITARIAGRFRDRDITELILDRSILIAPLIARGTVLGNFVLFRKPERPPFDELETATAQELGRRAALSIDNARLYQREVHAAAALQRSMLPRELDEVYGAPVSHRYLPAMHTQAIGGDWFDAIPLPGSRIGLVVGDVMGHGVHSAAAMGQFRTAVRTLASLDLPPARLLRQLDDLALRLGEEYLATCLYAVYDPVSRRCEISNAGHVPPVLVQPDGKAEQLELPSGAPIGVGGVPFETVTLDVRDGSRLVLCTDGLVEERGKDIDEGIDALITELTAYAKERRTPGELCDRIVRRLVRPDHEDDVAVLVTEFAGIPGDAVAAWSLEPQPTVVRQARTDTLRTLARWGLETLAFEMELLVSELVTNAIVHGGPPVRLRLLRADRLVCEVHDGGHDLPVLRPAEETDEHGRGLQLVTGLAKRWGVSRTGEGKVVWFELEF
ncbi:MAG: SpoIIE family protein phosphatase [Streptosporangiales bacterium]|nr:SpoIIE family protein phosphatase [Streptosporangiales bacterium]